MAAKWNEVEADADYQALPDSEKDAVKQRYWDNVISKDEGFSGLGQEEQSQLQQRFFGQPQGQEAPEGPSKLGQLMGLASKATEFAGPIARNLPGVGGAIQAAEAVGKSGELSQLIGGKVAEEGGKAFPNVPPQIPAAAGLVAQFGTDLSTFLGGAAGGKVANKAIQTGKGLLPSALKTMANVPEAATEQLLKDTTLLAKNTGGEKAIEGAVSNLQSALKGARSNAGERLGRLKELLGINTSFQDGIFKLANTAQKAPKSPEQLAQEYLSLKATKGMMKGPEALRSLVELRQHIGDAVSYSNKAVQPISSQTEGLLKQAAKDINRMIEETPKGKILRKFEQKFSEAADVYDDLQKRLADPGQAEQTLTNLFTSKNPATKDLRNKIAELEKVAGKKLLEPLFKEFAAKELNKWVGRPGLLQGAATVGGAGAFFNPASLALLPAAFAAQSPKILSRGVGAASKLAPVVRGVGRGVGSAAGGMLSQIRAYLQNEQSGGR